ncbi:MAG: asparaginase [Gammaproteobacteria bacterium]|nr:asparaginase [Gammaproteobacteria bacterium]
MRSAVLGMLLSLAMAYGAADTRPVCQLIATGGTIAMRPAEEGGAPVPADSGEALLAAVPELAALADMEVLNLYNVPSPHMDPARWVGLHEAVTAALDRDDVAGVIVTHGTDVLEETAWFLDLTVKSEKPVVLTGAMRDAASRDFDGPHNLLAAAKVCVSKASRGRGTMLVMDNLIHAGREVRKGHTSRGDFNSGEAGALGEVRTVGPVFWRRPERRQDPMPIVIPELPRVDIVAMYPGADGTGIEAAVAAGAEGIVIAALGLGNVNPAMARAIEAAIEAGVVVMISSRVADGSVAPVYGYDGGGASLQSAGAVFAWDLSPQKVRIALMLILQYTEGREGVQVFSPH